MVQKLGPVNVTDQRGFVRRVVFGSNGYISSETRALGKSEAQTTTYQYYADNLLKSVTDALGRVTAYTYDVNGNTTQITRLSGTSNAVTTTFTYESSFNQLASVTDPLNHATSFSYDTSGNLTTVTDPLNHQTTFTHNTAGQPLTAVDGLSHTTTFSYDSGDLVSITDPLSRSTTRFLDFAGRLLSATDPLGNVTRTYLDALNEVTKVTDALGNATAFTYDGNGNLLTVTDANNHATTYTYDNMDRLATRTDALTNAEGYSYDAAGNLVQFTDRRGKVTSYKYDGLNRRTLAGFGALAGPIYESTISYAYDGGNRLSSVVDSVAGTITPTFDNLDRLTSEVSPQGTVSYTYDAAGRRTSMTVAGQTAVNYTYDNANRLTGMTQGTSTSVSFAYDNASRRTSLTLPNGIVMSYGYDNGSQLTGITYTLNSTTLGNLTYGYDLAGRRTSTGGSYAQTGLPLGVSSATYNANNQLTQWGTASLYYEANGNMTSDGFNAYSWNARNQLASMNFGSNSFQYDAYGRRAGKTLFGSTTNYLYDGANIVQELSGTTPTANLLTGGIDEYFTRTDSTWTANFLTDALGSTLALAGSSGTVQTAYSYEPFGNTSITGSATTSYQYTGRENDGTSLYFYRSRYYSPGLQRFISEDPAGFGGGDSNLYSYTLNSPANLTDPSGEVPLIIPIAAIGAVAGAVNEAMTAHSQGASGIQTLEAAGQGAVAGATAAVIGTLAAVGGVNPMIGGAAAGLSYDLTLSLLRGQLPTTGTVVADTLLGGALGPVADALTSKVPGRFPDLLNSRPLEDYGPKSIQVLRNTGLGSELGVIGDQILNMLRNPNGLGGRKN